MIRNVEDRLASVERDVRALRRVLLLFLVVAAGLLLAVVLPRGRAEAVAVFAATALLLAGAEIAVYLWRRNHGIAQVVRAKKFEVVDERGRIYVEIGETTDGRGAVVTHDGDHEAMLVPARSAPRSPAATPDENNATNGAAKAPVSTLPAVDIELSYRGDGTYEAKVTERRRSDVERAAREPSKPKEP